MLTLTPFVLAACPAEWLRVDIREDLGETPVQVQDLERDAWNLSSSLGAERARRLKARLRELELEPAFGSWGLWSRWEEGDWLCGLRGERHRQLIVASDDRHSLENGTLPVTMLLALAKNLDHATFCIGPPLASVEDALKVLGRTDEGLEQSLTLHSMDERWAQLTEVHPGRWTLRAENVTVGRTLAQADKLRLMDLVKQAERKLGLRGAARGAAVEDD